MTPFAAQLRLHPFIVIDGGLATELEAMGCDLNDPLWSARVLLDDPALIEAVHERYANAGAQVLTTATYQATVEGLMAHGRTRTQAEGTFRDAVDLARRVAQRRSPPLWVAGSIGSYGASLADGSEYRGAYGLDRAALREVHRSRVQLLAPHCDLLAAETLPSLTEALAFVDLLTEFRTPGWLSFSCRDALHTAEGVPLEACAQALRGASKWLLAWGLNCCDPAWIQPALEHLAPLADRPFVVYPNAGEGWAGHWHGDAWTPERLASAARGWWHAGARWIGGCCRTGPDHIAALRDMQRQMMIPAPR